MLDRFHTVQVFQEMNFCMVESAFSCFRTRSRFHTLKTDCVVYLKYQRTFTCLMGLHKIFYVIKTWTLLTESFSRLSNLTFERHSAPRRHYYTDFPQMSLPLTSDESLRVDPVMPSLLLRLFYLVPSQGREYLEDLTNSPPLIGPNLLFFFSILYMLFFLESSLLVTVDLIILFWMSSWSSYSTFMFTDFVTKVV